MVKAMNAKRAGMTGEKRAIKSSKGFTLPEVMTAVLCFMLAALPLLSILEQTSRAAYNAAEDSNITFALQQILENAKVLGFESLLEAEESGALPTAENRARIIINGNSYSYSLSLSDYPAVSSDQETQETEGAADGNNGLMLLTAAVYYGSGGQRTESMSTAVCGRVHYTK